jgi:hypothetical protein
MGEPSGPLTPYASRTTMRSAVDAMARHGWRMLTEPSQMDFGYGKTTPPLPYMIDNGAWGASQRETLWDGDAFLRLLDLHGEGSDMTVLPDIVGGGSKSLARSLEWVDRVRAYGAPLLLAVQDGMDPDEVESALGEARAGIFVGGSTEWKIRTLPDWGRMARRLKVWLHVARVNTAKRIRICQLAGAHSFDGTNVTRFPQNIGSLERARRQMCLF